MLQRRARAGDVAGKALEGSRLKAQVPKIEPSVAEEEDQVDPGALDPALVVPTVDVTEEMVNRREAVRLPVRAGHLPAGVELVAIEPPEVVATPR